MGNIGSVPSATYSASHLNSLMIDEEDTEFFKIRMEAHGGLKSRAYNFYSNNESFRVEELIDLAKKNLYRKLQLSAYMKPEKLGSGEVIIDSKDISEIRGYIYHLEQIHDKEKGRNAVLNFSKKMIGKGSYSRYLQEHNIKNIDDLIDKFDAINITINYV